ncbi:MAG: hypothetical protein HQK77_08270 [Desulfobacterales bacterium]|nr:hypothetical protein [Desulfobacterales bacterium]
MPYSTFTFEKIKKDLSLSTIDKMGLFSHITGVETDEMFSKSLTEDNIPIGLAINTEKARSELIIMPMLLELRKMMNKQISLFSGIEFNVDEEVGLNGVCDFVVSLSSEQFFLDAPVVVIVEAKKEDITKGLPQCIAEMRASQIFNEKRENQIETVYGVVTTGSNWKFLKLQNQTVYIDFDEYHIKEFNKIMGILLTMCLKKA